MRLNKEGLFRVILLLGIMILLLLSLITGKAFSYVHPRMQKYIIISIPLLIGMIFFEAPQLKLKKHRHILGRYGMIVTPMILICFLVRVDTSQFASEMTSIANVQAQNTSIQQSKESIESSESAEGEENGEMVTQTSNNNLYKDSCTVPDEEYAIWFSEVYNNLHSYVDQQVTLKVRVFHDPNLPADEVFIGRGIISCCAADAQYYGYACYGADIEQSEDGSWLWITGSMQVKEGTNGEEPIFEATKIETAEPPEAEFSYF